MKVVILLAIASYFLAQSGGHPSPLESSEDDRLSKAEFDLTLADNDRKYPKNRMY